jgi:hypothetical protein
MPVPPSSPHRSLLTHSQRRSVGRRGPPQDATAPTPSPCARGSRCSVHPHDASESALPRAPLGRAAPGGGARCVHVSVTTHRCLGTPTSCRLLCTPPQRWRRARRAGGCRVHRSISTCVPRQIHRGCARGEPRSGRANVEQADSAAEGREQRNQRPGRGALAAPRARRAAPNQTRGARAAHATATSCRGGGCCCCAPPVSAGGSAKSS